MRTTAQREATGRDTKAEIHRAAIELFSTRGYEKTSLREIAEQVGITKASLYYHYSSKQDLLQAVVGNFFAEARAVMDSVKGVPWSPERECELLGGYLDVVIRHRHVGPAILRDLSAVLAVYEENIDDLIESMQQVHSWLAGPGGSVADRLRATAATETIGAVLSSGLTSDEASDDLVREVLLDAALAVLGRRQALG